MTDGTIEAARKWLAEVASDFREPIFVTWLFKDRLAAPQGGFIAQSPDIARNEVKRVTNRIDRAVFGTAVQRYQRRVRRIPILECGVDRGWHCHMIIERPEWLLEVRFRSIINEEWSKSPWAAGLHTRYADSGALDYLTKERSKGKLDTWSDAIVTEALVLNTK